MIEINLLPPNMRVRKREAIKLPSLAVIPIAVSIIGVLVAFQIILLLTYQIKSASLSSLKKKNETIRKTNEEAVKLDNAVKEISSRVEAIDKLKNSRFNMAKKLNDLSDSMISGVWLRNIDVKKGASVNEPSILRETLVIDGSSVVTDEKEGGSIGKFVNSLKENTSFSDDFDEIELSKVERKKIRNTEVLDFIIICHFKKGRGL